MERVRRWIHRWRTLVAGAGILRGRLYVAANPTPRFHRLRTTDAPSSVLVVQNLSEHQKRQRDVFASAALDQLFASLRTPALPPSWSKGLTRAVTLRLVESAHDRTRAQDKPRQNINDLA